MSKPVPRDVPCPICPASTLGVVLALLLASAGCPAPRSEEAPAVAPPGAPGPVAPDAAPASPHAQVAASGAPATCPSALALTSSPLQPTGRSPQLVEHSGDLRPPLPWVVAESAQAGPAAPLLLLLHGRGDSPERFLGLGHDLASRLPMPVRIVAARAPLPLGVSGGRQWFGRDEAALAKPGSAPPDATRPEDAIAARVKDLDVLLGRLRETWPEAPPPLVVGFSQGAMVALHLASALGDRAGPPQVGGIVALSGMFAVEVAEPRGSAAPSAGQGSPPAAAPRPPLLIVAGTKDSVVPAARAWEATAWFAARGFPVACHAFDGTHRVTPPVLDVVAGWLAERMASAPGRSKDPVAGPK